MDCSSPLQPPRMMVASASFSSISSTNSSLHPGHDHFGMASGSQGPVPGLGALSPGGLGSPMRLGDRPRDEDDDLPSDVEKSFGEAMVVCDDGPSGMVAEQGVEFPFTVETAKMPSAPAQPQTQRTRVSSLRRGTLSGGSMSPAMLAGMANSHPEPSLMPPPMPAMMTLSSPGSSEEEDPSATSAQMSPTARRRHTGPSRSSRRPDPCPIQASSLGASSALGSDTRSRRDSDGSVFRAGASPAGSTSSMMTMNGMRTASSSSTSSSSSGLQFTARPRAFGRESSRGNIGSSSSRISNFKASSRPSSSSGKSLMLPPSVPEHALSEFSTEKKTSNGKRPRMAIPTSWSAQEQHSAAGEDKENAGPSSNGSTQTLHAGLTGESAPMFVAEPTDILGSIAVRRPRPRPDADGLDTESPFRKRGQSSAGSSVASLPFESPASRRRNSASPLMAGSPDLGSYFCDSPSAPQLSVAGVARMRDEARQNSSPSSPLDSPSNARAPFVRGTFEKTATSAGLWGNASRNVVSRRTQPYKRPMLPPLTSTSTSDIPRVDSTVSAFPVMESGGPLSAVDKIGPSAAAGLQLGRRGLNPMRRAFSVCDQGAQTLSPGSDPSEEGDMDASPCGGGRVVSHFDASSSKPASSFKTVGHSASIGVGCAISDQVASPFGQNMLGFGENEKDGKILPCHRVKEDGLVRITPATMRSLLNGEYKDQMHSFHVFDCRFDYEYHGGHIEGAVNVKNDRMVEEMLLQPGTGIHTDFTNFPIPSRSGTPEGGKPIVVVFHCEFSNKRAPAFAKHLRSKDRTMNNQHYPKVFYPELYILEGGYFDFFNQCPDKCDPQAYRSMNDPAFVDRCETDLHNFRAMPFNRTRSFTYGEGQSMSSRSSAPLPAPLSFAVPSKPAEKRASRETIHEEEDVRMGSPRPALGRALASYDSPDSSMDGSPCGRAFGAGNPVAKNLFAPPPGAQFGSIKNRNLGNALGRSTFTRVASYAGHTQAR